MKPDPHLLLAVSGHGYGHLAQCAPVINALWQRLPRLRLQFPNIVDRYVMRTFFQVFALVTISVVVVYMVADFTQKADQVLENQVAGSLVTDYYKYLVLQYQKDFDFDLSPFLT